MSGEDVQAAPRKARSMNADEKISQNDLSISACTHGRAAMHLRVEELGWILPESSRWWE
jgi:hypothetical protein